MSQHTLCASLLGSLCAAGCGERNNDRRFSISLAAWSLHRSVGIGEDKLAQLDMPRVARDEFGIGAVELVNTMLASTDGAYLDQLSANAAAADVAFLLIMVDNEGDIAARDLSERDDAVARHCRWVDIAHGLGCHSIRLNWRGGDEDAQRGPAAYREVILRTAPPLRALCDYADRRDLNVLIENHGGLSSQPEALLHLLATVDHPRFGLLPDFGNFPEGVDPYLATDLMMNYAKAVSAKCSDFDDKTGEETTLDYARLIAIVCDKHGYQGHIGIEYAGTRLTEHAGIRACKRLLGRLGGR